MFSGLFCSSVTLYNSLGHARQTVVRLYVSSPYVQLKDSHDAVVPCQLEPFWTEDETASTTVYKVCSFCLTFMSELSGYVLFYREKSISS